MADEVKYRVDFRLKPSEIVPPRAVVKPGLRMLRGMLVEGVNHYRLERERVKGRYSVVATRYG